MDIAKYNSRLIDLSLFVTVKLWSAVIVKNGKPFLKVGNHTYHPNSHSFRAFTESGLYICSQASTSTKLVVYSCLSGIYYLCGVSGLILKPTYDIMYLLYLSGRGSTIFRVLTST